MKRLILKKADKDNNLRPYQITITDDKVIVEEGFLEEGETPSALSPTSEGLGKKELQKIMPFFSQQTNCFFEGCESLREAYIQEVNKAGGDKCPGCVRGSINRKYIQIVYKKLKEQGQM